MVTTQPKRGSFACTVLEHKRPASLSFDGVSYGGTCPRCQKLVLQDSQGNWFALRKIN